MKTHRLLFFDAGTNLSRHYRGYLQIRTTLVPEISRNLNFPVPICPFWVHISPSWIPKVTNFAWKLQEYCFLMLAQTYLAIIEDVRGYMRLNCQKLVAILSFRSQFAHFEVKFHHFGSLNSPILHGNSQIIGFWC